MNIVRVRILLKFVSKVLPPFVFDFPKLPLGLGSCLGKSLSEVMSVRVGDSSCMRFVLGFQQFFHFIVALSSNQSMCLFLEVPRVLRPVEHIVLAILPQIGSGSSPSSPSVTTILARLVASASM